MRTGILALGSSTDRRGDYPAPLIRTRQKQEPRRFRYRTLFSVFALALMSRGGQQNDATILIRLNTRGGMLVAAREIVQNRLGAALMVLALVLFVAGAQITSDGIFGAGGAVAMVLDALVLVDSPVPEMSP